MSLLNKEPVSVVNGLSELLKALLPLLVVVGLVHIDEKSLAAWVLIIGLVLGFVSTTLLRSTVVTTQIADQQIRTAIRGSSTDSLQDVKDKVEAVNG